MKLALGAAVILAVLVALWLVIRKADETPAAPAPNVATGSAPGPTTPSKPTGVTTTPMLPDQPRAPDSDSGSNYVVGDVNIRDHRHGGSAAPMDVPPGIHPPDTRVLPSPITHAIGQKVRALMMECVASMPREARGADPRLEGQIVVSITSGKLAIVDDTFNVRDVSGAAQEQVRQCVQTRAVGLDTTAPNEPDIEKYSLQINYAIP